LLLDKIKPTWKILLVDDDQEDFYLTRSMLLLSQRYTIELDWRSSYAAGIEALKSGNAHYAAALVDYDLGDGTGIALIREANRQGVKFPLILLTGRGTLQTDMEAIAVGATFYLAKNEANPLLLERVIRYAIHKKQSEVALEAAQANEKRLEKEAQSGAKQGDSGHRRKTLGKRRDLTLMYLQERKAGEARQTDSDEDPPEGLAFLGSALQSLFDHPTLGIAILDADCVIQEVNDTFARFAGHRAEAMVGRDFFRLFPAGSTEAIFRRVAIDGVMHAVSGQPFEGFKRPAGDESLWDWSVHALRDGKGDVKGMALTLIKR
jgi:PAS domain S-box-containing protein